MIGGETMTYKDLDERSSRFAHLWRSQGLRRGDHVAVLLGNQAEIFEVTWAAQETAAGPVLAGGGRAGSDRTPRRPSAHHRDPT
jgi:non-ribosomal peptide synthetase component E (peptide arylation enzyme)